MARNPLMIFTKPWKCSIPELGEMLAALGVDGLELPVRPGYPVTPDNMIDELPKAVAVLKQYGQTVYSIGASVSAASIAACGAAGVPVIRDGIAIDMSKGYYASVAAFRRMCQELTAELVMHNVKIGVQNHCNNFVGSAIGLMHVIGDFAPQQVGAVLDLAHCRLDGEPEAMAIDIVWTHLSMVFLKNAYRMRINGPEAEEARWRIWWTTGRHGFASWRTAATVLQERGYSGPVCLTPEYSESGEDPIATLRLVKEDVAYTRSLFS